MHMWVTSIVSKFLVPKRNIQKGNQMKPLLNLYFGPVWVFHAIVYFLTSVKWGRNGRWLKQKQELNFLNEFDRNRQKQSKRQIMFKLLPIDE